MIIETKKTSGTPNDHNRMRNIGEFDHRMIDIHIRNKKTHFNQDEIKIKKDQIIDFPNLDFENKLVFCDGLKREGNKIYCDIEINEYTDDNARNALLFHTNDSKIHVKEKDISHKNIVLLRKIVGEAEALTVLAKGQILKLIENK